jgi:carbonic anhydrase/acetyltransferase-like protein (isoleucine patch superfamily)
MIESFKGKSPKIAESALISEGAHVVGDVEIGEDSSVWPGAVIRADLIGLGLEEVSGAGPEAAIRPGLGGVRIGGHMKIGSNTHIEDNVVIHFTKEIGDNVVMGHGAVVEALRIGNNVVIGSNATVLPYVEISNFCIIAAGALVPQGMKIPDRSFVVGVPAQIKGELPVKQIETMETTLSLLAALVEEYKKDGF